MLNFWPFYIREAWQTKLQGCSRVGLFGAGEHSRWLLDVVGKLPGPQVVALIDDRADSIREINGIRVITPDRADPTSFDRLIISSDTQEEKLFHRARLCFPDATIVRLYQGLPPGPYDKQGDVPAGIDTIPGPSETVNLETVVNLASSVDTKRTLAELFNRMDADPYARRLADGYARGAARFKDAWRYVDLWSVLYAFGRLAGPKRYLEIGTRRGHSLAAVLAGCRDGGSPAPSVVSCDVWVQSYAGAENPGPTFVAGQMKRIGFDVKIEFLSGSSHELLPPFLRQSGEPFDLMTVDGDHSREGARADLLDVVGHLRLGGLLAFDDIHHPQHTYLGQVWREVMNHRPGFETYENPRNGTGIAAAIRYRSA